MTIKLLEEHERFLAMPPREQWRSLALDVRLGLLSLWGQRPGWQPPAFVLQEAYP